MRALLFATLTAVAAVGLAGCGQDSAAPADEKPATETTSSQPPSQTATKPPEYPKPPEDPKPPSETSAPVSLSPTGVVVPDGVTKVPTAQVDSSALPVYYEHRGEVWEFDGGRSLQLFAAASSGCTDAEAVVLDQSAADIRITVRPLNRPPGGRPDDGVCTAQVTPRPVVVRLDAPLGDRTIYLAIGR
jgi:hypothetical protein